MEQVIKGIVIRKKFQRSDNLWHVVVFRPLKNGVFGDDITVTGYIPWSSDDDLIEMKGSFEENKYGRTFVCTHAWQDTPSSPKSIREYLMRKVDGFGGAKGDALVAHFGSKLKEVLDNTPNLVSEVKGITPKLAASIKDTWNQAGLEKKVSLFLAQHDISDSWRKGIVNQFGVFAVEKITNNPYCLTEIKGIGFTKADEIAKKMGVEKDSPERINACVDHVLTKAMNDGHCFLPEPDIRGELIKLTKAKAVRIDQALKEMVDAGKLIRKSLKDSSNTNIPIYYLPSLYESELNVAKMVKSMIGPSTIKLRKDTLDGEYTDQQTDAILSGLRRRISVITGAPGTGKSTTLRGLVEECKRNGIDFVLAAPTGRAAQRLTEITGEETVTIHRLLKYDGDTGIFRQDKDNPISSTLVVIDEASMVDIAMAESLLEAIGPETNVVFIGDTDQLPSVGPGSFLKDLIKSGKVHTTMLTKIFRQAAQSLMVQNSHRIKNGECPQFPPKGSSADSYVAVKSNNDIDDATWAEQITKQMISVNIPAQIKLLYNQELDIRKDVQVLIPMKKGTFGVHAANVALQKIFNPNGYPFQANNRTWHIGDKVIQTTNNYTLDVYNGDIGIINHHDSVEKKITVTFGNKLITYDYSVANDELDLANAISIHKSQGSEYKVVIVVLLWQHFPMLERNLLYTANTRAKLMTLYIVAGGTIQKAVDTNKVKSRNSLLGHRIRHDDDKTSDHPCGAKDEIEGID